MVGRWEKLEPIDEYVSRIDEIPLTIGNWAGQDNPLDQGEMDSAGISGHIFREYTDATTGKTVSVLLVCGRPGPISVHTPDVCYRGAGFKPIGSPEHKKLDISEDLDRDFWQLSFIPPRAATGHQLDIYWAWNDGTGFTAPASARLSFGGKSALYKMYVLQERLVGPDSHQSKSQIPEFMEVFLPVAEAALANN